jgi:hypothetical protein
MSPTKYYMDRSEGGVLPNIQAVLLPKKTESPAINKWIVQCLIGFTVQHFGKVNKIN